MGRAAGVTAARCARRDLHRQVCRTPLWARPPGRSLLPFRHPMRSFWALPLRRQLFVVILLLLVTVLVAVAWLGVTTFRERTAALVQQADIVARTTAAYVNRDISELDNLGQRLAITPAVRALDPDGTRGLFSRLIVGRSAVLRLALATPDGAEVASFDVTPDQFADGG